MYMRLVSSKMQDFAEHNEEFGACFFCFDINVSRHNCADTRLYLSNRRARINKNAQLNALGRGVYLQYFGCFHAI